MFCYLVLQFQVNRSSGRHRYTGQQRLYEFCYLLPFDLWTSYLARILFLKGCGSLFWESPNSTKIFNGLQHSFQVWQRLINVSESFSYKDFLFILATKKKKKKISELILPSDLILLAYMRLLKGNKSDPIIFRILDSDLLLLLLFSS
jgi:hypothetical protein